MSSLIISPNTDPFYFETREEEINDAITTYYDYITDKGTYLSIYQRKCILYDYDYDRVILIFPLIFRVDMEDFIHRSKWIKSFEYIGTEIMESEMRLLPSSCIPKSDLTIPISEYLETNVDEHIITQDLNIEEYIMIQDISIAISLSIKSLSIIKIYDNKTLTNLFQKWIEYGTNEYGERMNRLEIGSYLSMMSKEEYLKIKMSNIEYTAIELNMFPRVDASCDNIITDIIYQHIVDTVVYCGEWWYFEEDVWKHDSGRYMWDVLSKYVVTSFKSITTLDDNMHTSMKMYIGSTNNRSRLYKDLSMKLSDSKLIDKMNSDTNLLGVANGTLILDKGILRQSVPSDYISLSCDTKYIENYNMDEEVNLMIILQQIFPRKDVLRFFIRSCASMLEGYNKYKVFYVWWGTGNNAKTLLQRFVSSTLGEYSISLSTSLITGRRSRSSDATPDMYYAKNKLVVFLQEPNPDERLQVGKIKELTGNDKMYVRELFRSGTTMEFKAKIVIVTNNPIEAPGMDIAFRRRIIVIPFETTFSDEKRDNKDKHQLPINLDMEREIFRYREAFLRILVREYKIFISYGLDIPKYIRRTTSDYMTRNNHPLRFVQQYIYKDQQSTLHVMDIYDKFKKWFWASCPGRTVPTLEAMSTELSNEDYIEIDGSVMDANFV